MLRDSSYTEMARDVARNRIFQRVVFAPKMFGWHEKRMFIPGVTAGGAEIF
jgi:hypothetical protein